MRISLLWVEGVPPRQTRRWLARFGGDRHFHVALVTRQTQFTWIQLADVHRFIGLTPDQTPLHARSGVAGGHWKYDPAATRQAAWVVLTGRCASLGDPGNSLISQRFQVLLWCWKLRAPYPRRTHRALRQIEQTKLFAFPHGTVTEERGRRHLCCWRLPGGSSGAKLTA